MKRSTVTGSLFFTRPNSGAEWVMRMHSGITVEEEREMREWLLRSERNNTDLLRAETVWRLSGALLADPEIQAELAKLRARVTPAARQPLWRGFSGQRLAIAASIVAAVGAALAFYYLPRPETRTIRTMPGEQHALTLEDGSQVAVNTNSSLVVQFTSDERLVTLERGEALFQVQHEQGRPFIVNAGNGSVRAVGTRFNVLVNGKDVTVSVLEGDVEVTPGTVDDASIPYRRGESTAYREGRLIDADPRVASTERILAWREGKLVFDNWPVEQALGEHNRYAIKPIRLDAAELGTTRITLVLRIGDTDALVGALTELIPVRMVETSEAYVLVRAPATQTDRP